jgi:raffinose/stachyose/melibiose transport system substrate-binding protein
MGAAVPALSRLPIESFLKPAASNLKPAASKVNLRMLEYETYYADDNQVWKAYEKTQDRVSVTTDFTSYTTYLASLITRGRTSDLEDLVKVQASSTFSGAFPLLYSYTKADLGDLYNELTGWSSCLSLPSESTYFAVPYGTVAIVWYWNKALLKKAGVPTDKPPATWADLVKVCDALKKAGITPIANGGSDNLTTWWQWSTLTVQYYPNQLDGPKFALGQLPVTAPGMQTSLGYMEKMYKAGWWSSASLAYTYEQALSDFIGGKAAIIVGLNVNPISWNILDKEIGKDGYLVSAAPLLPDAKTKVPWAVALPNQAVAIAKDTQHYQEAYNALEFLVSAQGLEIMLKAVGQFPNRSDMPILEITGSPGAGAIQQILKGNTANAPLGYMSAGATDIGQKDISEAIVSGKTMEFLTSMEGAQKSALLK